MTRKLRAKVCEPHLGDDQSGFGIEVEFDEDGIRGHDGTIVIHLQDPRSEAAAEELRDTINRLADSFSVTT